MKKIYTLAFLALAGASFAQPTMQSWELNPNPGESYTVKSADWMPEGNWGLNVTWDFSGLQENGNITIDNATPSGLFPAANLMQTTGMGGQSSIAHMDASTTGQFIHGIEAAGTVITYQTPMKVMSFPLDETVYETNNFSATFTSGGFNFTRTGTSHIFADAYGTIITPEGTFTDVMRVRITIDYVDTYSGGTITSQSQTYAWYKAGVHYALASVSQLSTDTGAPTQYSAQYLTNINLGVEESSSELVSLYPNPVASDLTIDLEDETAIESYEVYNSMGQLVNSAELTPQSTTVQVDFTDLDQGIYFIRFMDANRKELSSKKIIRN